MATAASGNAAVGTVKVVVGEVKVIGIDGVARQVQIGDKVYARETIQTAANAVVQVQLENGRTLDLGRDSRIALDDDLLAVGQTPTTAPATGDIAALQAQIAAGADPSKVAEATAAGGAPGAGGAGDGGGGTPVVISQANATGDVNSGFDTAPASITFPGPSQAPLVPTQPRVSINDVTILEPRGRVISRDESQSENDSVSLLALTVPGPGEGGNSLVNGLGGAAGFGENFFFRNDDSSTGLINISSIFPTGMNFFGTTYTGFYINNNGNITFDSPLGTYTPFGITANNGGNPMIAPFFADFDTRPSSSHVSPGGTSTGTNGVYWDLDTANGIITITWDDVGYFANQTNLVNAVQLRIFATGGGNFGFEFRYENVEWTTGGASGGSGGLGGSVAHAGWTAGDGINFYELPQSGNQAAILDLEHTSNPNTAIDGNWVFNVVGGQVVDNVDTTTAIFTVSLDQVAAQDVFVSFTTADGSAISGGSGIAQHDYGATSGVVRIPAGQLSATIQVTILGDGVPESNEQFFVNLTGIVSGPAVIADNQGVGTILDDTPTLSISDGTPNPFDEGQEGSVTFLVTLSNPVDHEITVDWSTVNGTAVASGGEGGDYFAESGMITFAPGQTTQSITIDIRDDNVFEDPEAFTVQLSNASPGATIADNSGTGNITDDDDEPPPELFMSISNGSPISQTEGGDQEITFTVTLSSASAQAITVDWDTVDGTAVNNNNIHLDGDFYPESRTITFAPGETTKEITVGLDYDFTTFEGSEWFTVQLSNASPGVTIVDNSGTGNIIDLLPPPNSDIFESSIDGGEGNDILDGSGGFNTVNGFDGDDILVSGEGNQLNGGNGNDTYLFADLGGSQNSIGGNFTIGDVLSNANADILDVHELLSGASGLAEAVADDNAATVGLYIQFDISGSGSATTAMLRVDLDGAGAGPAQNLASFTVPAGTTADTLLATLLSNNQIAV